MSIGEMNEFVRLLDLIGNRFKVLNDVLGYALVGAVGNPCRLDQGHGWYLVMMRDSELARFRRYDVDGASVALQRLDAVIDGICCAKREGLLRVA